MSAGGTVLRHPVVLPDPDKGAARGEPRVDAAEVYELARPDRALCSELPGADTRAQHPDRYLCWQSQAATRPPVLEHDEFRPL